MTARGLAQAPVLEWSPVTRAGEAWLNAQRMARRKAVLWGFDQEQQAVLLAATTHIPTLRAIVERARPYEEIPGLLVLRASIDELDQVYTLVEDLTDGIRNRRRRELLDSLRASLCSAMDGF